MEVEGRGSLIVNEKRVYMVPDDVIRQDYEG